MAKLAVIISIFALVAAAFLFSAILPKKESGNLDDFSKCLAESGAVFYGSEWCGHCASQKTAFGDSFVNINYVECAGEDGQTKECAEAGVRYYPTWRFSDGSEVYGEQTFEFLAEKTGCSL